jgi:membrane fusion protein (multidrug efflux system)
MLSRARFAFRGILVPVLVSGLLTGGCVRKQQQASAPPATPEVTVVTVQSEPVVLTTELPGRTSPYRVAEIRPQVNGLIQKRLFTEGSDVKAGQVLYQVDPAPFEAALKTAEAALIRSQATLPSIRSRVERYKDLLTDKAVSQQDYDDAVSALNQAEADVQYWTATAQTARINLGYTKVTAPIAGRIGRSEVTDGALVAAYQPAALSTIQQLDPIYVDVPQSTAELLRLQRRMADGRLKGNDADMQKVKLLLDDASEYPCEGTLQFRDVTVDWTTGSVILRVVFPNPQGVLLPGMFVRAVVREGVQEEAILVPQQAVSRDPKGNPVTLVVDDQDKVQQRILTLDRAIGNRWLVTSGLTPGDRVIVSGLQRSRPGASVKIASPDSGDPSQTQSRPNGGA